MNITLGENIKRLRRERQLTQEQLAEALEVSFQAVSEWENKVTYPDIEVLPVIAGYFDVSLDELMQQYDKAVDTLERAFQYAVNYEERPDKRRYSVLAV